MKLNKCFVFFLFYHARNIRSSQGGYKGEMLSRPYNREEWGFLFFKFCFFLFNFLFQAFKMRSERNGFKLRSY